jgi:hypothetical protein
MIVIFCKHLRWGQTSSAERDAMGDPAVIESKLRCADSWSPGPKNRGLRQPATLPSLYAFVICNPG